MKKYYLFLLIVLLLGCKKDKKSSSPMPPNPPVVSLINLWELQTSISDTYTNGNLTNGDTTYAAPNDFWIRFNNNNTFIEYENTAVLDTGNYTYSNNLLTVMSGIDTIKYTTILTSTTLILHNIVIDYSAPDTTIFDTELTFRKI